MAHQHGFSCIDSTGNRTCQISTAPKSTPAPKPARVSRAKKFNGTCPCCFGSFAVGGYMVLHGYTRPGFGYINGRCPASDQFPPYEVANEGTVYMLGLVRRALATAEADLAGARAVTFIVRRHYKEPASVRAISIWNKVERAQAKAVAERDEANYEKETIHVGDWNWVRAHRVLVANAENTVKHITEDVARYSMRVTEWQPVVLTQKRAAQALAQTVKEAAYCSGAGKAPSFRQPYADRGVCSGCGSMVRLSYGMAIKHKPKPRKFHKHDKFDCYDRTTKALICAKPTE